MNDELEIQKFQIEALKAMRRDQAFAEQLSRITLKRMEHMRTGLASSDVRRAQRKVEVAASRKKKRIRKQSRR